MFTTGLTFMDVRHILANLAPIPKPIKHRAQIFTPLSATRRKRRTLAGASGIGARISATGIRPPGSPCPECTTHCSATWRRLRPGSDSLRRNILPILKAHPDGRFGLAGIFLLLLPPWFAPLAAQADDGSEVVVLYNSRLPESQ